MNEFYARFDRNNSTIPSPLPVDEDEPCPLDISDHDVRREFGRLKEHKAAGPDQIRPKLLKLCKSELASVFSLIFNWSLQLCKVPKIFKFSNIVPVPKKLSPSVLNDYRPVALTSCIMKSFENIILNYIGSILSPDFDTFQFAYKKKRSIDDALTINCHEILKHLESKNSYARILFIDYSSAFNTIIPQKLYEKLVFKLNFPLQISNWILDFLLDRPQVVKIGNKTSSVITLNTGTPQGCPMSPKLYSIFTYDCVAELPGTLLVKYADDTTVSGFINNSNETNYRNQICLIEDWCKNNNLILNVSKTKEIIIDFRLKKTPMAPLLINDSTVEQVSTFKFLGTYVSNDLSWEFNSLSILSKARQRLYFLRKLKSFNVNKTILINFYRAIVESVLTTSITVWFDRTTCQMKSKLQYIVRVSEKIIGAPLPSLELIYLSRLEATSKKIMNDRFHPAFSYFDSLPSGRRLRAFKGNKRFINSFYPQAIKFLNGTRNK